MCAERETMVSQTKKLSGYNSSLFSAKNSSKYVIWIDRKPQHKIHKDTFYT